MKIESIEVVATIEKTRKLTENDPGVSPALKSTIQEYDFTFHPDLYKKQVMSLFDLDFISKKENVIFLGPPGVGNYAKFLVM